MMKLLGKGTFVGLVLCLAAGSGWADWEPWQTHKMHWPQFPDLTPTGLDVDATGDVPYTPNHLADDFLCTATGPITDIHIWGSFLNDRPPEGPDGQPDPGGMVFRLSIHADFPDPDGPGPEYSRPLMDPPPWQMEFAPGDPNYRVRLWADGLDERYWNPTDPALPLEPDTVCWQFNFFIDEAEAFRQKEGEIYWLDVQAWDPQGLARWGWKTTNPIETEHFNDDAVFWDPSLPPDQLLGQWNELRYPLGHPFEGQSIDLAFVITPEPTTWVLIGLGTAALAFRRRRR